MTSLNQQRQVFRRQRASGRVFAILGPIGLVVTVARTVLDPSELSVWLLLVGWASLTVFGFVMLHRARRGVAAFDAEHGAGAGSGPDTQ